METFLDFSWFAGEGTIGFVGLTWPGLYWLLCKPPLLMGFLLGSREALRLWTPVTQREKERAEFSLRARERNNTVGFYRLLCPTCHFRGSPPARQLRLSCLCLLLATRCAALPASHQQCCCCCCCCCRNQLVGACHLKFLCKSCSQRPSNLHLAFFVTPIDWYRMGKAYVHVLGPPLTLFGPCQAGFLVCLLHAFLFPCMPSFQHGVPLVLPLLFLSQLLGRRKLVTAFGNRNIFSRAR